MIRDKIFIGEQKMKQKYISPECEIIKFNSKDIITTSTITTQTTQTTFAVFDKTKFLNS